MYSRISFLFSSGQSRRAMPAEESVHLVIFWYLTLVFAWQNQINTSDTRLTTKQLLIQDRKKFQIISGVMPCLAIDWTA
ncbi:hypothetical protein RDI61_05905 [Pseudomonas plecoglossicida]|jgi:hypothetical protein|uniref:hypothetical protein n=1 Tax=Pseudomonas TaxID=286 RepID=UPI0011228AD5|nr:MULTISPECIES: hypothetical protein [Pseudomonas]EKT4503671.1 hypothetical protein [Pseudomonas putida]EKT4538832.1 hypothetical protein [Pseudomonas putida]EKT4565899.1 hypothetical protein [Pseudomonas putida]ELS0922507.1 hypothetical protein [Pseudomonas putida]MCE0902309.1 hypothetical protein [Pseudomonas alloputida]